MTAVFVLAFCIVRLGRLGDSYVPLEFTFLLVRVIQAVLLTTWTHGTPGKWLLGLSVRRSRGGTAGFPRVIWRETVARAAALLPLGLGLWWILLRPAKRGWHDYLAGTRVVRKAGTERRRRWAMCIVAPGALIAFTLIGIPRAWVFVCAARMIPTAATPSRPAAPPREVHTVTPAEYTHVARWLDAHGHPPEEHAITVAARHPLTIFGESHHVGHNLRFLARIVPELYHRAGVRCLAMESLVRHDNAALMQLVTTPEFDRAQAVALARRQGWKSWGSREYVDILEAVWRLNRTLSADQPPLRVIGLDREWDLSSWALVGLGDDARAGPWWERLRLLRVLVDLPLMVRRDELMALELEREVFATRQRGVAWVGAAHAYTRYAQPLVFGDASSPLKYRMGAILQRRHPGQVCHIRLYDSTFEGPALAALIEAVQGERGHSPVAFDVAGCPFADLRDGGGLEYHRSPHARFSDFADGYVFLKPLRDQRHCAWETGFITRSMFLRDKPYYEAYTGRRLRDAREADQAFRRLWEQ